MLQRTLFQLITDYLGIITESLIRIILNKKSQVIQLYDAQFLKKVASKSRMNEMKIAALLFGIAKINSLRSCNSFAVAHVIYCAAFGSLWSCYLFAFAHDIHYVVINFLRKCHSATPLIAHFVRGIHSLSLMGFAALLFAPFGRVPWLGYVLAPYF